jgi:hypothetical protein
MNFYGNDFLSIATSLMEAGNKLCEQGQNAMAEEAFLRSSQCGMLAIAQELRALRSLLEERGGNVSR